jgi:hypothetical protein
METREELMEQHAEWITKYLEADKRLRELHPPLKGLLEKEQTENWVLTKESLVAFQKAERDLNRALAKIHKIMQKLYKLRWEQ